MNGNISETKYYVYTLLSLKDFELYTSLATDLRQRLSDHYKGLIITKISKPFKLIHYEYFLNFDDAKDREHYLKSNLGRSHLKQITKKSQRSLRNYPYKLAK